jgi:signal transduction histidine kinase
VLDSYDGATGIEIARRELPDLILLDYMMPDMDGEEVFKQLSSDARYPALRTIPVIMLTGHRVGATRSSLLERGVSAYLQKPFGLRELSDIIDNVLVVNDIRRRSEKNDYQLRMLHSIALAMQSAIDIDELLHLILSSITAGQALGFSRAMVFLGDERSGALEGKMGVGPASAEEAWRIWQELSKESLPLEPFLEKYGRRKPDPNDAFDQRVRSQRLPLASESCIFTKSIRQMRSYRGREGGATCAACRSFLDALSLRDFIAVPLVARDRLTGLIIADRLYGESQPVHNELVAQLELFARQAAVAIEKADAYVRLEQGKRNLEKAYADLKETHLQLLHAERLATVGKMTAHVAHEIRNPLVTIGGFARSLLKKAQGNVEIQKSAGIIAEEALRLEKILANVLNFTRLPKPTFQLADLNCTLREICALFSEEAHRRNIHLNLQLDPLPLLRLDGGQITQAVHNLVRNSMQSFGDGQGDGNPKKRVITISSGVVQGQRVCLKVSDTGAGIPADVLENMFDPFFTTKPDGTGLGLPITRQIITEHGGHIEVASKVGKGTTFFVYLPMAS